MERKELYNSATNKLQKIYGLIFDENGNMKPEFNLTDEEIEAFRSLPGDSDSQRKALFETLFGGIIYNKYTFMCEPVIQSIFDLSYQIYLLCKKKNSAYNSNQIYTCQAHNWNGNILFSGYGDPKPESQLMKSIKIGLYNLNDTYSYEIDLFKDDSSSRVKGKLTIIRDKLKKVSLTGSPFYQDCGVETHNLNEISSKETTDILVIAENELSQILNNLTLEANKQDEKQSGFSRR